MNQRLLKYAKAKETLAKTNKATQMWWHLKDLARWESNPSWSAFCDYIHDNYNNVLPRQLRKTWVIQALRNYSFRHDGGIFFRPDFLRVKEKIAPGNYIPHGPIVTRVMPQVRNSRTY